MIKLWYNFFSFYNGSWCSIEKKEKSNLLKNAKKTWKYVKDAKIYLFGYLIVSIAIAVISAIAPLFSAKIILSITDGIVPQLIMSALVVFFLECLSHLTMYLESLFYQKIYRKVLVNLQISLARETLKLEVKEIDKASSGVFIDRLNKDTTDLSGIFMYYSYYVSSIISNIGVLFTIFLLNKYMFAYAVITSISIYFINKKRLAKMYEVNKKLREVQEKKTGLTGELVRGIRDIKVLNADATILNQTTDKIIEASNEEIKMLRYNRVYLFLERNIRSVYNLMFFVLGAFLLEKSLLTIPTFIIIYNYQGKIKNLLTGVVQILEYNKKFVLASDRIYEIIDDEKFEKEKFGNLSVKKLSGNIKFRDVEFGYDDNTTVLNKMNFEIKPNERVAFVGKSGSGKTTIFGLITKLYSRNKGEILFDDHNIDDLDCTSLRNNMSMITQNPYIFNFSIKENLLLAKENATMREIRNACKMACIDDFIMSLPNKYDSMIGENGVILSGGQKQRLAIARALLMKTEIILFDEATSALDNETQSEIQKALDNLKGKYTILIVAHRLSTVVDCDRIFVVNDGKIIDSGTHRQLLKRCEFYKNLYEKDLNV